MGMPFSFRIVPRSVPSCLVIWNPLIFAAGICWNHPNWTSTLLTRPVTVNESRFDVSWPKAWRTKTKLKKTKTIACCETEFHLYSSMLFPESLFRVRNAKQELNNNSLRAIRPRNLIQLIHGGTNMNRLTHWNIDDFFAACVQTDNLVAASFPAFHHHFALNRKAPKVRSNHRLYWRRLRG